MLNNSTTFSNFSTDDLDKAENFYKQVLGLKVVREEMGILTLELPDSATTVIYPKGDQHNPAGFTVLNFVIDDIDETVDMLTAKGITFEQYEGDIQTDEKGISRGNGPSVAWFKDPAGNILSIIEEWE